MTRLANISERLTVRYEINLRRVHFSSVIGVQYMRLGRLSVVHTDG